MLALPVLLTDYEGAERKEVRSVFAADSAGVRQLEVGFVGQCRGIKAIAGARLLEVPAGDPPQFRIHKGRQPVECVHVAALPFGEQYGYVVLIPVRHFFGFYRKNTPLPLTISAPVRGIHR